MMDLHDGHNLPEKKGGYMDEDGCDFNIIIFFGMLLKLP